MDKIAIGTLFTREQLVRAFEIIDEYRVMSVLASESNLDSGHSLNDRLKTEIVTPEAVAKMEQKTGRKFDADYLCYVLQYAHTMTAKKG